MRSRKRALILAYPIWLDDTAKEKGYVEAVKLTEPILSRLTPVQENDSEWLAIRLEYAKACRKYHEVSTNQARKGLRRIKSW